MLQIARKKSALPLKLLIPQGIALDGKHTSKNQQFAEKSPRLYILTAVAESTYLCFRLNPDFSLIWSDQLLAFVALHKQGHIGVNLLLDTDFKHMLKNQNDDKDDLRLFSIVIFVVESDSGVKWSLEMVPWGKKGKF